MFKFMVGKDGVSIEPEWFTTAEPGWRVGDRVFIRPGLAYRVVAVEIGVLVVERE